MRIGIDIAGGDLYPAAPIGGVKLAQPELAPDETLVLVGPEALVRDEMARQQLSEHQVEVWPAEQIISMEESGAKGIAAKPASSIAQGLKWVKEGKLDAFVSAGNTGAMVAGAVILLGVIPGVSRPTLAAAYPLKGSFSLLCDVGANIDCKPEHLVHFGKLGAVYMQSLQHLEKPRVALLNVGEEPTKGNAVAQQAYAQLAQQKDLNFIGNAEGRDMLMHKADVYVVDGFTGNIMLKFAESFYHYMAHKLAGDADVEALNLENIGGLPLLGVQGNVIIGHGISSPKAFQSMIRRSTEAVRARLTAHIVQAFSS